MKLIRIIISVLLLLFFADIARYVVLPDVGKLVDENPVKTAFMENREAEWKEQGLTDKKIQQKWVSLNNVSPNLIKAVLIAEDDKFWKHEIRLRVITMVSLLPDCLLNRPQNLHPFYRIRLNSPLSALLPMFAIVQELFMPSCERGAFLFLIIRRL